MIYYYSQLICMNCVNRLTVDINSYDYYNEEYIDYFFFVLIVVIICSLMLFICYLISSPKLYYEKLTGYECGFDPFSEARDPFEVKFYLISILFILFDIELLYFFP